MPFLLSQLLDACRWIGALVVLAVHATNMFVSLADIMSAPHAAPVYGWWFFASFEFGHQAVVGFFVMSGYLVGGAALSSIARQQDFLSEYLIHRFARIYMVLAPALLLTFVLDTSGQRLFGGAGIYDAPLFRGHYEARDLLANLLNLQGITADFYGVNGPLWSLACEFWYYMTFPLLLLPLARNYSPAARVFGFALGLGIVTPLLLAGGWFRFGYFLWGMGALATLARRPLMRSRWLALSIYVVTVIPIRLLVRGPYLAAAPWLQDAADLLGAACFLNLILTLRFGPAEGWSLLRTDIHKSLASFSFSLYSIHMPALIFMRAMAAYYLGAGWPSELASPLHWAAMGGAMLVCIALAIGFSRLTEEKTAAARRLLRHALGLGARAAQTLISGIAAVKPGRRA